MAEIAADFEHRDGVWRTIWQTARGRKISVLVIDEDLMASQDAPLQLQEIKGSIDDWIDNASFFANQSPYRDEIAAANGIVVDSVVVSAWDDFKVWFTLGKCHRMLAVSMHEGRPVDVYCDHP
jgi:hypothetical protein